MNIFEEVKNLNFPVGKYVVVGSSVLEAHTIRPARDIDIVVTPDLYKQCEQAGWEKQWHETGQRYVLHKKGNDVEIEVYLDVNCAPFNPTIEELIERSETIQDLPFISLDDLLQFKKAYGRPQDGPDVQLIEDYLSKKE